MLPVVGELWGGVITKLLDESIFAIVTREVKKFPILRESILNDHVKEQDYDMLLLFFINDRLDAGKCVNTK